MARRWTEVLADFLQGGHPGNSQVTVLQTHPSPFLHGGGYHFGSDGSLALPQRDGLKLGTIHVLVTGKLQQACGRILLFLMTLRSYIFDSQSLVLSDLLAMGSAPGDSTNTRGMVELESK